MLQHDLILYHFTSDRHINGVLTEGLTRGVTYAGRECGGLRFLKNTQWLTINPIFQQSWNEYSKLPYDRTANRLTICIPQAYTKNLIPWEECGRLIVAKTFDLLSMYGDPENWVLYMGSIPPEWIMETTKKWKDKVTC